MTTKATDPSADDRGLGPLIQLAGQVLAPAGVLTAVLYHFGYVREKERLAYFGVDLGSVGLSTTDYLLSSAGPLFSLLATVVVIGVAAVIAHHLLSYLLSRANHRWQQITWVALSAIALVLLAVGSIGMHCSLDALALVWLAVSAFGLRCSSDALIFPVMLGGGALLLEYATENARTYKVVPEQLSTGLAAARILRRALVVSLVLIAAFWATDVKAKQSGLDAAYAIESALPFLPQAIVYSRDRLYISGHGVGMTPLSDSNAFAFRYNGLRLLKHAGGRWFLLPVGWRRDNGATVKLLPDSRNDIRVELAP
ncbi:hypothetical protein [Streptosporangium minutum]|uniref:Uncharacterized protein n=1 Tax=Streptosporangium minutum TaxID=569862 RepID=A0A243RH42_9ACTN|nr:hypothetical protein [Streptosporangium minutum]OUC94042.1 hypothetical protein CA984_24030 [Streptosporangium minutum]